MMLKVSSILGAVVLTGSLLAVPMAAQSDEPSELTYVVDGVEVEVPELPDVLSAQEMAEIDSAGTLDVVLTPEELNEALSDADVALDISDEIEEKLSESVDDVSAAPAGFGGGAKFSIHSASLTIIPSVSTALTGDRCYIDPGIMWKRSSGAGEKYGAIGSKPRLFSCTPGVRKTGLASDVYRWNGWNWTRVAGTFTSYGTGNMQQKSVMYKCANTSSQLYKVVTTGWGTNSRGQTGVGRDSTGEFRFSCG